MQYLDRTVLYNICGTHDRCVSVGVSAWVLPILGSGRVVSSHVQWSLSGQ